MLLLMVREPVKTGFEAAYRAVEDGIARAWLEFECPEPALRHAGGWSERRQGCDAEDVTVVLGSADQIVCAEFE